MRAIIKAVLLWGCLLVSWPAAAGTLEDGQSAYNRGDYAKALLLWGPLAEKGDAIAQHNLGVMYTNGQGVPLNYEAAVKWYRLAATQGFARAQHNLGVMYGNGQGVPQNYTEAVKWYRLAATQGLAIAQYNLGYLHATGYGTPKDDVLALMWFDLAAAQGVVDAVKSRAIVADRMTLVQIARAQRMAREWKPTPAK